MKYILVLVLVFFAFKNVLGEATGELREGKIPLYIRAMMSRESESVSKIAGSVMEAAATHMNNLEGILDDYDIRFQWNHTKVRIRNILGNMVCAHIFYKLLYSCIVNFMT